MSKSCLVPVMAREEGKSSSVSILPASAAEAASLSFSPSHCPSSTLQPSVSFSLPGVHTTFKHGVCAFSFTCGARSPQSVPHFFVITVG